MNDESAAAALPTGATTTERHVIPSGLFRARARRVQFSEEPVPEPPPREPVRRPAKVAKMLALAHHIQWAIDRGEVPDAVTVARRLGLTRARVSQLLGLCFLAPSIQEEILGLEAVDGREPMAERGLRGLTRLGTWAEQWTEWTTNGFSPVRVVHPTYTPSPGQHSQTDYTKMPVDTVVHT